MDSTRPTVALVNDTSQYEHHFGCQLVCQTFREQFARTGLDLRASLPFEFDAEHARPLLSAVDLVVVNGEGSLHHDRGGHLLQLAKEYPAVLVNCVYEKNSYGGFLQPFLYRAARESLSADEIRAAGAQCDVVPDLLFASQALRSYVRPEPTEDAGYTDNVTRTRRRVSPFRRRFGFSPYVATVTQYLAKLASYRRVCAGRFHAAVACAVIRIPFSTWDSNTWKTRGLMGDIGVSHLHFKSFDEALANVPDGFDKRIALFAAAAPLQIEQMFDRIAQIAQEQRYRSSFDRLDRQSA